MPVVAARVHHSVHFGPDRSAVVAFEHRQRVHVGTQHQDRPGPLAVEIRGHPVPADTRMHREAERIRAFGGHLRGARLLVRQLRVPVQITTDRDQLLATGVHRRPQPRLHIEGRSAHP